MSLNQFKEWSLIMGRGGYKTGGGGGQVKFYPYEKGGAEKVLAMLKFWVSFCAEVLTILKGGTKSVHSLKGGPEKFYPDLRGGGRKMFRTRNFPIL